MNPYDFVRVVWQQPGKRDAAPRQDRFSGISGRLEGTITTLTPFLIRDPRSGSPQSFLRNAQGQPIIPGASLKGLFRSLVETVDGGAWWFFGDRNDRGKYEYNKRIRRYEVDYSSKLGTAFQIPQDLKSLDAACRMFGFLDGGKILAGSVGFEDGVCNEPVKHDPFYTCILSSPKPRHRVWYLDDQQRFVRGRKFYFHSTELQKESGWKPTPPRPPQNQHIRPIGAGSVFTFRAHFTSVSREDLALLLYALVLEPDMRHKAGYGKSAGLGSIEVKLNWLETVDYAARYQAGGGGITRHEQAALTTYVDTAIQPFTSDTASVTLQDLRRIWRWPAVYRQRYPTRDWFNSNPGTPIGGTP